MELLNVESSLTLEVRFCTTTVNSWSIRVVNLVRGELPLIQVSEWYDAGVDPFSGGKWTGTTKIGDHTSEQLSIDEGVKVEWR